MKKNDKNQDGTRHDKHTFDENFRNMKEVKRIARMILKIKPVIEFQFCETPNTDFPKPTHENIDLGITEYSLSEWSDDMHLSDNDSKDATLGIDED